MIDAALRRRFRARLRTLGVCQSTTRGGAPGENAHMESFFHSLKADVIHGRQCPTARALRHALRRYMSPVDYERRAA